MFAASEAFAAKISKSDLESLRGRLTAATCHFSQHLATQRRACLAQIWVPDAQPDGSVTLHTQGVPFSVAGCADLLALFRCVSCRYKFGTDIAKPALMGSVGRVFTTGKPEMLHNVQQYDKQQFLRVEEAHRCRVHSALFMPLYTSQSRRHPFGVIEVVQADTDVLFPVLVQWLKACLQEVQLYTADPDQSALSMGLRVPTLTSSPDPLNHKRPTHSSKASPPEVKQSHTEEPDRLTRSATMTHCSASSLHAHGPHTKGFKQGTSLPSAVGAKPGGRMREVSADSEEVKTSSSVGRSSPELSSPAFAPSAGPRRTSCAHGDTSGELQTGSGGSFATPPQASTSSCPPAQLVTVGKTLQLQISSAPTDLQAPILTEQQSIPMAASAVANAVPPQSPFLQLQQQQSQQQQTQQQQWQHQQQQLQHYQRQQQLQFLANALQLQSQLKAHTQAQPGAPAAGGSAFAGYQPFSPTVPTAQLSHLVQQHSAPVPHDEEEGGDEEVQVNNRVAGGAGKRLSVEDLQSQFGVGLREAAHNLRICPTTLKRACRRHGIYRWPRRQSWGGGVGDEGRTDSMNLDGDSLSSAGQPPLGSAAPIPATGERSLSGLLSSCSSGQLALQGQPPPGQGLGQLQGPSVEQGPGQLPGQSQGQSALEGFQRLDSTAQIALLQRLTAAKAEGAEGKWLQAEAPYCRRPQMSKDMLQGSSLSTALKLSSLPRAPAANPPAVPVLSAPARQLGSGVASTLLATGLHHAPQPSLPASQHASLAQHNLGKAARLSQPGIGHQHSISSLPALPNQKQLNPFMDRQSSTPGQVQGIPQHSLFQQSLPQQLKAGIHMSSGLLQASRALPTAFSSHSNSGTVVPSQTSLIQPSLLLPWQQQAHTQAHIGLTQAAYGLNQQSHMPASSSFTSEGPNQASQLGPSAFKMDAHFLPDPTTQKLDLPPLMVKSEPGAVHDDCDGINEMTFDTPTAMQSGQGSAAMQFDASDHGLESLDFLGGADLSLDHPGALDFDPEDCMF